MLHLLNSADRFIPGIEKVLAIYYDPKQNTVVCKERDMTGKYSKIEDFNPTSNSLIQDLRNQKVNSKWLSTKSLPFEMVKANRNQLEIFDECENLVLNLGFENAYDHKTDLLYIYLRPDHSNFGIPGKGNLTTNEKSIIASMISHNFNFIIDQHQKDFETLKSVGGKVNSIQAENEALKLELQQFKDNYQQNMLEMCQEHLLILSENYGIQISLAQDAMDKIELFNGNMDDLKAELDNASAVAVNLNFGLSDQVVLKSWDIHFNAVEANTSNNEKVHERYQRTLVLLDKLEGAARSVINNRLKLTSENVGSACPTPISAPAISDALKNHQKKVLSLMQNYPDRWSTIRNEFRPVRNILQDVSAS